MISEDLERFQIMQDGPRGAKTVSEKAGKGQRSQHGLGGARTKDLWLYYYRKSQNDPRGARPFPGKPEQS